MNNLTSYHPANCDAELSYFNECCPNIERGSIRHIVLVEKNYRDNTLKPALDAAGDDRNAQQVAWLVAKAAGKAIAIKDVRGSYAEPSETTQQGFGGQAERVIGLDHEISITDPNLIGNIDFLNQLYKTKNYVLYYCTASLIWDTIQPFAGVGKIAGVEEDPNSEVYGRMMFRWKSIANPQHYWLPELLFNCEATDMEVEFVSFVAGTPNTVNFLATFEQAAPAAGSITLDSVSYDNGTVVTDVTANYTLTGTPVTVAISDATKALPVTTTPAQSTGTYIYVFLLTGAGRSIPQRVEVTQVVV